MGRYGCVTLDHLLVAYLTEKGESGPGLINCGVYALRRDMVVGRLPPFSIERDVLPNLVAVRAFRGLPTDSFFIDIGVPESLEEVYRSVPNWWEGVPASDE